ncbi:MAG: glycerophosphodiester phosphodiesterase [Rhodocyclaceae bacterium]
MKRPAPSLPRYIAHRCGGVLAPENTLAGLRQATARGYRAVEFDVMLSADGTPVLIHDETLERTTNGIGRVCDTPDAVLFSLDAGQGENIPTLVEAAALCQRYGLLANIEIKPAAGHEARTAETVARFVAEHWRQGVAPLLSSFSYEALCVAHRLAPQLQYGLLYETVPPDWQQQRAAIAAVTLHCAADAVSDEVLGEAAAAGVPVLCYTVNRPDEAEALFARGVSSLFTDRIDLLG